MNELLKNKIKLLYSQGHKTVEKIQAELNRREQVPMTRQVERPLYQLELAFRNMVLAIVGADAPQFMWLNSAQRELFIKQKIDEAFMNAVDSEGKISALKTGLELQNLKALLEKNGSELFSDPLFAQQYATEPYMSEGQSWLEENGQNSPSDEEIREAILN